MPLREGVMSATAANKTSVGLPSEQLQQWLVWVREDLDRISEHVAYMLGEQARLGEQERLLGQLLQTVAVAESEPGEDGDEVVEGVDAPVAESNAEPVDDAVGESDDAFDEPCASPVPSFAQPWMTHF